MKSKRERSGKRRVVVDVAIIFIQNVICVSYREPFQTAAQDKTHSRECALRSPSLYSLTHHHDHHSRIITPCIAVVVTALLQEHECWI